MPEAPVPEAPVPDAPTAPSLDGHGVGAGGYTAMELDYPVQPRARWGHGRPPHRVLAEILGRGRDRYRAELLGVLDQREGHRGSFWLRTA